MTQGNIVQIIGPVVDVAFPEDTLPGIYNALSITREDGSVVTLEVARHLGGNRVRTIALSATDGLSRGTAVTDTGAGISVPVGEGVLGRVFNVLGESLDQGDKEVFEKKWLIHRSAPPLYEQE